jgi:hypothetical protein
MAHNKIQKNTKQSIIYPQKRVLKREHLLEGGKN